MNGLQDLKENQNSVRNVEVHIGTNKELELLNEKIKKRRANNLKSYYRNRDKNKPKRLSYYQKNREWEIQKTTEWRLANLERSRENNRKSNTKHREARNKHKRDKRAANPEHFRKQYLDNIESRHASFKKYAVANRDKINARRYARMEKDPVYKLRIVFSSRLSFELSKLGLKKICSTSSYGINFEAIANHLGIAPNDGKEYEVDHIRPLSSFNLADPEQIKIAFAPENHQWLEKSANRSKGAKLI